MDCFEIMERWVYYKKDMKKSTISFETDDMYIFLLCLKNTDRLKFIYIVVEILEDSFGFGELWSEYTRNLHSAKKTADRYPEIIIGLEEHLG